MIMGHSFPDMDAFGAAVGVSSITRALGIDAYIALDENRSFAGTAVDMLRADGWDGKIIDVNEALALMTRKTLLVVVDTHKSSFVDFPTLYEKASATVVIDHHRKSVDHIKDALIFFHDPNASSTCEMVTELMRYITPAPTLSPVEAQAMLAGIMLDTKEFVLSTGVRTFEAAAFLKGKGADTVAVKRLFSNSIESNRKRSEIISAAHIYRGCAIACTAPGMENARLLSAQAADELLEVSGVKASFVIFDSGKDSVNISARSYGAQDEDLLKRTVAGSLVIGLCASFVITAAGFFGLRPLLQLLDTPGILWPKFDDPEVGKRLAFTGAVKDDVLDIEELACYLMDYLAAHYADTLTERYKIEVEPGDTGYELLEKAGRKRGFLMRGAQVDTERMARILLDEFRAGKLGRFTLETAPTEEVTP